MQPTQLTLRTAPASEVLTLDEAKAHLNVDFADQDDLISALIAAARELAEAKLSRSFISTGWTLSADCFPGMSIDPRRPSWVYERPSPGPLLAFYFPRARVLSVDQVRYLDTGGTLITMDPSLYEVQLGDVARLTPVYGRTWPATRFRPGAVQVDFTAGYGADATSVPASIKVAVKLILGNLWAHRGDDGGEIPKTAELLMASENWGAYG